jgi:hypothetical protein
MKRGRAALAALLVAQGIILGLSALPGEAAARHRVKCGAPGTSSKHGDKRDTLCASIATASKILRGDRLESRRIRLTSATRNVVLASGETKTVSTLDQTWKPSPEDAWDEVLARSESGEPIVLLFPARSLFDNSPGNEDYHPDLPIGILVSPELVDSQDSPIVRLTSAPSRGQGVLLSDNNLTLINSGCQILDDDGDGNDENANAYLRACWHSYKPSQGDGNASYKWRVVFNTGSTHGGNWAHNITKSHVSFDGNANHVMDDWGPTSTNTASPNPETTTVSVSGTVGGVGVSVSHTFEFYSNTHGPISFGSSDDYFKFGWLGSKGCDGQQGVCDYWGVTGGARFKIPESSALGFVHGLHIQWDIF